MAGKGLGSGLGALFGDAAVSDIESSDSRYLPISKIEPRKDQPRSYFNEEALADLADSIREHGVIQPLTVRSVENGYYQIIAGERRWRASRMAGLTELPVRIIDADDKKAMELAMVENLQREDLNPIEEANGYKALIEEYGMTQEEAASRVGKSRPVVANSLRLLTLPEDVIVLVEEGKLTLSHARAILEISDKTLRSQVAALIVGKNLTVREATSEIKRLLNEKPKKTVKEKADNEVDYVAEAEKSLSAEIGRRVKIVTGKKKGQIIIEYYGNEDFENLFEALKQLKPTEGGK